MTNRTDKGSGVKRVRVAMWGVFGALAGALLILAGIASANELCGPASTFDLLPCGRLVGFFALAVGMAVSGVLLWIGIARERGKARASRLRREWEERQDPF